MFFARKIQPAIAACLVMLSPAISSATDSGAVACELTIEPERRVALLSDAKLDMIRSTIGFFERPCDGGLYLVALTENGEAYRVNESWWFVEMESARWSSANRRDEIVVTASFITGIGPTGARPFPASITMKRTGDGWVPQEPVFPDRPQEGQPEDAEETGQSRRDDP